MNKKQARMFKESNPIVAMGIIFIAKTIVYLFILLSIIFFCITMFVFAIWLCFYLWGVMF